MKNFLLKTFASKRAFSLYWRTADMLLVGMADMILTNLASLEVNNIFTVLAGLVLGELTKAINSKAKNE